MSRTYCIADHGPVVHQHKDGRRGQWKPTGPIVVVMVDAPARSSKRAREDKRDDFGTNISARLFVGLNVGQTPTYKVEDVVRATRDYRKSHHETVDSSFIAQSGLYTDQKSGEIVDENSVQVVIFDVSDTPEAVFEHQAEELAQFLRKKFEQQTVLVELQNHGEVKKFFMVSE
jgi:hypothetical protein